MPLRAMAFTGQKYLYNEVQEDLKRIPWFCPHCFEQMVFVDANTRTKHFRHLVICPYETEPESRTHLETKKFFCDYYKDAIPEYRVGNKIIDVFVPSEKIGIECQVSSISYEKVKERIDNAKQYGILLIWVWFGKVDGRIKNAWQSVFDNSYDSRSLFCYFTDKPWRAFYSIRWSEFEADGEKYLMISKRRFQRYEQWWV